MFKLNEWNNVMKLLILIGSPRLWYCLTNSCAEKLTWIYWKWDSSLSKFLPLSPMKRPNLRIPEIGEMNFFITQRIKMQLSYTCTKKKLWANNDTCKTNGKLVEMVSKWGCCTFYYLTRIWDKNIMKIQGSKASVSSKFLILLIQSI